MENPAILAFETNANILSNLLPNLAVDNASGTSCQRPDFVGAGQDLEHIPYKLNQSKPRHRTKSSPLEVFTKRAEHVRFQDDQQHNVNEIYFPSKEKWDFCKAPFVYKAEI